MKNKDINISELFRTNPAEAWRIIDSSPSEPINKEEFFKELARKKAAIEKKKREQQNNNTENNNEAA